MKKIKQIAVLGSGVMGSRLACHFANGGFKVLLLDIVPLDLKEEEKNNKEAKNRIVNAALQSTLKSNPSPIYDPAFSSRITTGNFEDDMPKVKDCEWILEAVVENLKIKKEVFENVEKHRTPGTYITTNTSGIPIEMMLEGRSEDFQKYFLGTHFFNPPRYLRLLEIIPSTKTDPEVTDFFMHFGDLFLGKRTVLAKDTPAFIANRVGVFSIMAIFHLMEEMELTIDEVDMLTGPLTGRPKSATFRTSDVVGIDTLVKVAKGVKENALNDEVSNLYETPGFLDKMVHNEWFGDKTGQGFYKKVKGEGGKSEILTLDLKSFEYKPRQKAKFPALEAAKPIENLKDRLIFLSKQQDKGAEFLRKLSYYVFAYVSNRIPEISNELYRIDDAMKAGFGWEVGPFEHWDTLGVAKTLEKIKEAGFKVNSWVDEMIALGIDTFYHVENGVRKYYDIESKMYKEIPGRQELIILDNFRNKTPVWKNSGATLHDIGDGVVNLEFHTKMNTVGGEVLEAINKSIEIAEKDYKGLVLGNDATNFSAGANLGMIFMLAIEQEYDELDFAVRHFQNTVMRIRYSDIPVVVAPHGLTLGGGCEMTMHADAAVAAAETYIGLVEVGVGVIPAGGGTKEMALRASDLFKEPDKDPRLPELQQRFITMATAKVATSGHEGFNIGVLDKRKDQVVINQDRVLLEAKQKALELADDGYVQPIKRDNIEVMGRTALGAFYAGTEAFFIGNYATEHDKKVANKLAYVLCGGDLSMPSKVSEQYLLDLEREAFLSLLGEKKTLERIQAVLKTGRPVRN